MTSKTLGVKTYLKDQFFFPITDNMSFEMARMRIQVSSFMLKQIKKRAL